MTISFRSLQKLHFPLLLKWLESLPLKTGWHHDTPWTLEAIEHEYHAYVEDCKLENGHLKKIYPYIIESDHKPIGYIHYYNAYDFIRNLPLDGLPPSLAALDFFIGETDYCGKGVGTKAFYLFLKKHVDSRFDYSFVDPENRDTAAIRIYEKAGFTKVKEDTDSHHIWMIRSSNLIIRKPVPADTKQLEQLFQTTRQKAFPFQSPRTFKRGDYANSVKHDEVWVAQQDKTIVGFVSIYPATNCIHNLFVHHAFQGKGIGKKLLQVAEKQLSYPITLSTVLDNFKARQFYENQGYEKILIYKNKETDEFYVTYRKDLL